MARKQLTAAEKRGVLVLAAIVFIVIGAASLHNCRRQTVAPVPDTSAASLVPDSVRNAGADSIKERRRKKKKRSSSRRKRSRDTRKSSATYPSRDYLSDTIPAQ